MTQVKNNSKFDISIITPVYNESENLIELYERIVKAIPEHYVWEIIFIDDGSTDNSKEIIRKICLNDSKVSSIILSKNHGHQIALTAGYDHALGKCVISLDSDLQHPPELIVKMLDAWNRGYEVVLTRRSGENLNWFKKITSRLYYILFRKLSNINIVDNSADYRLLDHKIVDYLKQYRETSRFIRGIVADMGFRHLVLDYHEDHRKFGHSKYNLLVMLNLAYKGILSFSNLPLRLSIYSGFIISSLCILYTAWFIYYKFVYGIVKGEASVMVGIYFIGGIQLISIGIIGEYIANIFNDVKNRPLYCITEIIGNKK